MKLPTPRHSSDSICPPHLPCPYPNVPKTLGGGEAGEGDWQKKLFSWKNLPTKLRTYP